MSDGLVPEDFADVEIYVRRPSADKTDDEEFVYSASYQDLARLSNRFIVESMEMAELDEGRWEVGIRERGDEQYHQRFELSPLQAAHEPSAELENRVAAILNHWRA